MTRVSFAKFRATPESTLLGHSASHSERLKVPLSRHSGPPGFRLKWVESGCGAVAVGWACLFPPLSSGGALVAQP
jgi:hypothetical protein